jgi:hypothetical protein
MSEIVDIYKSRKGETFPPKSGDAFYHKLLAHGRPSASGSCRGCRSKEKPQALMICSENSRIPEAIRGDASPQFF